MLFLFFAHTVIEVIFLFTKRALLAARIHTVLLALSLLVLTWVFLPRYAVVFGFIIVISELIFLCLLPFFCRHTVIFVQGALLCIHTGRLFSKTSAFPLHLCSFVFLSTPLLTRLDLVMIIVRTQNRRIVLPYLPASAEEQLLALVPRQP